jgi:hypothetical protein
MSEDLKRSRTSASTVVSASNVRTITDIAIPQWRVFCAAPVYPRTGALALIGR